MQFDFGFVADDEKLRNEKAIKGREAEHMRHWAWWKWDGPKVGEPLEIASCIVALETPNPAKKGYNGGDTIYAYTERCIALEERPDGSWVCEIAMGIVNGEPWPMDGTRVVLKITDIDPPRRDIQKKKEQEDKEPLLLAA